jgi:O-antigen/teichoic acid export membrane protein
VLVAGQPCGEASSGASAPSHSVGSRLIQNSAANFCGQAVIVGLTFLATPYITRKLGPSGYGALSLLMAYLFSFSLLNLGMNASLVKFLAELIPERRWHDVQGYFSTSFAALVTVGLVAGAAVWSLAGVIVKRCFTASGGLESSAVMALRIASIAFVLQFLCQVLSAVPAAAQRFEVLSLIRAGSESLRILGTVALLWVGRGLPALMGMVVFAVGVSTFAYAVAAKKLIPNVRLAPGWSKPHLRSLLGHSKFVLVVNASNQLVGTVDSFLIGFFLPVANVAYYGIAYALAQRLWVFLANIVSVVFPAASAFSGASDQRRFKELYLRGMKVTAMAGAFPSLALCIYGSPFLRFWLGPDYAQKGAPVLILVALGFLLNSFSFVAYQVWQSTHRVNFAARASLIYSLLNLTAFLVLIPRFGILGAAAGFLISQALFVPWFVHRTNVMLGVRWGELLMSSYLGSFASAGVAGLVCLTLLGLLHSLVSLVVAVGVGAVVYMSLSAVLVLDQRDRDAVRLLLRRWSTAIHPAAWAARS